MPALPPPPALVPAPLVAPALLALPAVPPVFAPPLPLVPPLPAAESSSRSTVPCRTLPDKLLTVAVPDHVRRSLLVACKYVPQLP